MCSFWEWWCNGVQLLLLRLWCMFEIAAFARSRSVGEKPKLLIRPTELTICHISQAVTVLFVTIVSDFVPLSGDEGFMWAFQAVNALIFGATFYANMAIYRDCFRSMEADGDKLAKFSLASVKSSCCNDNHQRSCGLCDRQITNKCITSWWGTREQFEEYVRTEVRALLLREHSKQFFTYRQAVSAMVPVLWLFLSKAAAWYRFTTFAPIMEASREVIRAVAWWLGVAPMALLVGTRLCYVFRRRCSWASADFLLNLPPLLGSVMVVVASQQLEHLCSIIDFPLKPEEHGLVPNVLVFAALVLSATIGLFACLGEAAIFRDNVHEASASYSGEMTLSQFLNEAAGVCQNSDGTYNAYAVTGVSVFMRRIGVKRRFGTTLERVIHDSLERAYIHASCGRFTKRVARQRRRWFRAGRLTRL
eukprot:s5199_g1.t1